MATGCCCRWESRPGLKMPVHIALFSSHLCRGRVSSAELFEARVPTVGGYSLGSALVPGLLRLKAEEHLLRHRLHRKVICEWEGNQYVLDLTRMAAPVCLFLSISYPPPAFIQGNFYVASRLGLKHCSQKLLCSPGIFSRDERTNIL